jgi:O-antigen ligase
VALGTAVAWMALRLGGSQEIDFYPVFVGLVLLFVASLADGLRVEWWGWLTILPLIPMALNNSVALDLLEFAGLWIMMVLGAHQMRKDWEAGKRIGPMIFIVLGFGVVEALAGLAQSLGRFAGQKIPFIPTGTIYNRNHYAGFLEMLAPLALMIGFAMLHERRRGRGHSYRERSRMAVERAAQAWIFLLAGALFFLATLFSLSRGGTLSAMIGTAVAALLMLRRSAGPGRSYPRVLALGLIFLVVAGALWIGIQPVIERAVQAPDDVEARTGIWQGAVRLIRDHPLMGVGAGMYGWARTQDNTFNPDAVYEWAHNDYLHAAAEWGVPAALVFFGTIVFMIWKAGKACVGAEDPLGAGLIAGAAGGVVALLLHSFVDYNLHVPSSQLLFGMILGSAYGIAAAQEVEVVVPDVSPQSSSRYAEPEPMKIHAL